jgi:hypothetical protein
MYMTLVDIIIVLLSTKTALVSMASKLYGFPGYTSLRF